jgi:hypothetical protein
MARHLLGRRTPVCAMIPALSALVSFCIFVQGLASDQRNEPILVCTYE